MIRRLDEHPLQERLRHAEIHFTRGMYALARDELEKLVEEPSQVDADLLGKLWWRLAYSRIALGEADEGKRDVDRALTLPELTVTQAWRLKSVRAFAALSRGEYAQAREIAEEAVAALRELGDHGGLSSALRWLGVTHLRLGELEAAFEAAYCALAEARHVGLDVEAGHAHNVLCMAFIQRGQYDSAREHGSEGLSIAERLGHRSGVTRNCLHLSIAARLAGDLEAATKYGLRALASAEECDSPTLVVSARLAAGRALRESGRLDAARDLVEGALRVAERGERARDRVLVLEDLGDLDWAVGNVPAALEKYRTAWRGAEAIAAEGDLVAELGWRIGEALLELGDSAGSLGWIEKGLAVSRKAGERKELAAGMRTRGLWHAGAGREEDARRDLSESLAILEAMKTPYETAVTHLAFERTLVECGGDDESVRAERREHLCAARRIFERIGAARGLDETRQAEASLAAEVRGVGDATGAARLHEGRRAALLDIEWASPAFQAVLDECRKLGPTSLPILLVGESGTGKTLVAEALHEIGRGSEGGFFPVNCAALPEHIQESELFGHRKGAFTGAEREHPGIFREAGRGTVLLDEIDKTSLDFQAKLLHLLDTRSVRPVGCTRRVPVEARIICATNRDLFAHVAEGRFLEDLHYRLTVGVIRVPPLRQRVEDLRRLTHSLLAEICALEGRGAVPEIARDGWRLLLSHDWPGNVRELKALLHRTVALNPGKEMLDAGDLARCAPVGSTLRDLAPERERASDLSQRVAQAEREEILRALEKAGGVRRKAAEILGVSYRGLGKKMARLGINGAGKGE
jgi:DNA-binding NtrC family response regulator/tetratricopeptide (TPR) repeat protein